MLDPTKEMILLKGEIKTSLIKSYLNNAVTHKLDVTFTNGKTYSYAYINVEELHNPNIIDINEYALIKDGQILKDVKDVYAFHGKRTYYHVVFYGKQEDYTDTEIHVVQSVFETKRSKDIWKYFRQISEISNLKDDSGEPFLKKQFEKIDFVSGDTALNPYINAKPPGINKGWVPIFPFGCNTSQYEAVQNAINSQLSVIQGPPGTGKTQTILNIIANLLINGKTVQIVSNNNSAIENVLDKLSSSRYNLGFIVAKLGKGENKKQFIADQTKYPDFSGWEYKDDIGKLASEIQALSQKLKVVYSDEEQIARLEHEKSIIEVEKTHFSQYITETGVELGRIGFKKKVRSSDIMRFWQILLDKSVKGEKVSLWQKILLFFRHGLRDRKVYEQDPTLIIPSLQLLFYERRTDEINRKIEKLKTDIRSMHINTDELTAKSMQYLKHSLAKRYSKNVNRISFSEEDIWKYPQKILQEYPVTLSTTHASKSSLGSKYNTVQYDYLIMDEASQVNIATGVLALSSSLNAVIVGDTKQLPNIVTNADKEKAEEIYKQYDLSEGYKYTKSFLQSVLDVVPNIPMTLLREHYRCHPKIINFCNQKYYAGELVVMTHDNGEENVIKAITTVVGNHERNHYNQRQIDVIKQEVIPELGGNLSDVGIIAPYRKQVDAFSKEINNVETDTVHKFQGREKDTIIISTVDDEKNDFSDDPYMINVAVSRAKKHLYIVASGNDTGDGNINDLISYIRYSNCEVVESKVYSIFDYLYRNYSDARIKYLKDKKRISEYDSENLMMALIQELLADKKREDIGVVCHFPLNLLVRDRDKMTDEEKKYAMNPLTHLDFVLYNKISKRILAAIEVDGYSFHKSGTKQAERDLLKNTILNKYDVPLLRFSTNGSGEKERLLELLSHI